MLPDIDWTGLTAEDLDTVRDALNAEIGRRHVLANAEQAVEDIGLAELAGDKIRRGDPWRQPVTVGYPRNWPVTHNGKTWESTVANNVWEPGVSGWREIVQPGDPAPAWIQPTGAHDAYGIGDMVRFQGKTYRSTIAANVWSPADHPAGWELVP